MDEATRKLIEHLRNPAMLISREEATDAFEALSRRYDDLAKAYYDISGFPADAEDNTNAS